MEAARLGDLPHTHLGIKEETVGARKPKRIAMLTNRDAEMTAEKPCHIGGGITEVLGKHRKGDLLTGMLGKVCTHRRHSAW